MKRYPIAAIALVCALGLAACSSSSSTASSASSSASATSSAASTSTLTIAELCPQVDAAMNAALPNTGKPPTPEALASAEAALTVLNQTADTASQALIQPLIEALKKLGPDSSNETANQQFAQSAAAFLAACKDAGAPLSSPSSAGSQPAPASS